MKVGDKQAQCSAREGRMGEEEAKLVSGDGAITDGSRSLGSADTAKEHRPAAIYVAEFATGQI